MGYAQLLLDIDVLKSVHPEHGLRPHNLDQRHCKKRQNISHLQTAPSPDVLEVGSCSPAYI